MNAPAATLSPIFASPFLSAGLVGVRNDALAALLYKLASEGPRDSQGQPDPLCYSSREDLFDQPDEAVAALKREMLGGLCAAVMAMNPYTEAEFDQLVVQARARFLVVRPDGFVPATTLPVASWCAVYCVAAPPAVPSTTRFDSGVLRLYEPRLGSMFADASNARLKSPFAFAHHTWRPVPGHMAAFPAHLIHEIALNRASGDLLLVRARVRFASPSYEYMPPW